MLPTAETVSGRGWCLQIHNMCNFIYALTAIISPSFTALTRFTCPGPALEIARISQIHSCIVFCLWLRSCKLFGFSFHFFFFRLRCGLNNFAWFIYAFFMFVFFSSLYFDKLLLTPFQRCCCWCCCLCCCCCCYCCGTLHARALRSIAVAATATATSCNI